MCDLPQYQQLLIFGAAQLIILLIERWLGKTEKTKASSILEVLSMVLKTLLKRGKL